MQATADAGNHLVTLPDAQPRRTEAIDRETVSQDESRSYLQPGDSPPKPLQIGLVHPQGVAISRLDPAPGDSGCTLQYQVTESGTAFWTNRLGIIESRDGARRIQDDGSSHQRTCAGTSPCLICSGDRSKPGCYQ